ncbi:MAG: sigma-E factor negative regulatory protein [Rubrivivax sp.]
MNLPRSSDDDHSLQARALLSDLADGHGRAADADEALRAWATDAGARQDWHLYQLIGDALRSDELACRPQRDREFLQRLRRRMADEPVPLAPTPLPAAPERSRRWLSSVAAVAGFAVVGAAVYMLRPQDDAGGWQQARTPVVDPDNGLRAVSAASHPGGSQALVVDGQVIRDARLDAYFEAHRGAVGPQPSAMPGGALRSVEILAPQR